MTTLIERTGGLDVPTYDIMVDFDDVVVPWFEPVHDACESLGITNGRVPSSWQPWEDYGCTKQAWLDAIVHATANGLYTDTDPLPGAVDGINSLLWRGHRVHVVTARGTNWGTPESRARIRQWTRDALTKFGIGHSTLTFSHDKVEAMEALEIVFDFAIDDGVHNYEHLAAAKVPVWLHTQRHNAAYDAERRIGSLWEFAQMIHAKQTVAASLMKDVIA